MKTIPDIHYTMHFMHIVILAILAGPLTAHVDYSIGAGGRLIPKGAGLLGTLGYGIIVWGDKKDEDSFIYGYVRPQVSVATSGFTNRLTAQLDVYPISFMGISFGYFSSIRATNLDTLDCDVVQCRGTISGTFARPRFFVGYERVFMIVNFLIQNLSGDGVVSGLPVADESYSLVGDATGDQLLGTDLTLGIRANENIALGVLFSTSSMSTSQSSQNQQALFANYKTNAWSHTLGVGFFTSTHHPERATNIFFLTTWTGKKSIGL